MKSGDKRFEVTIERRVDTQTADGLSHSYEALGPNDLASIKALQGREFFAAQQLSVTVDTEIRIHWRKGIDETCRVVHRLDGPDSSPEMVNIYDITAVLPDMKTGRRELVLMCVRRVAEGWRRGPAA